MLGGIAGPFAQDIIDDSFVYESENRGWVSVEIMALINWQILCLHLPFQLVVVFLEEFEESLIEANICIFDDSDCEDHKAGNDIVGEDLAPIPREGREETLVEPFYIHHFEMLALEESGVRVSELEHFVQAACGHLSHLDHLEIARAEGIAGVGVGIGPFVVGEIDLVKEDHHEIPVLFEKVHDGLVDFGVLDPQFDQAPHQEVVSPPHQLDDILRAVLEGTPHHFLDLL